MNPRNTDSTDSDSHSLDSDNTFNIDLQSPSGDQISLVHAIHSQVKGNKKLIIYTTPASPGTSSRGEKTPRSTNDIITPLTPIAFNTPPTSPNEAKAGFFSDNSYIKLKNKQKKNKQKTYSHNSHLLVETKQPQNLIAHRELSKENLLEEDLEDLPTTLFPYHKKWIAHQFEDKIKAAHRKKEVEEQKRLLEEHSLADVPPTQRRVAAAMTTIAPLGLAANSTFGVFSKLFFVGVGSGGAGLTASTAILASVATGNLLICIAVMAAAYYYWYKDAIKEIASQIKQKENINNEITILSKTIENEKLESLKTLKTMYLALQKLTEVKEQINDKNSQTYKYLQLKEIAFKKEITDYIYFLIGNPSLKYLEKSRTVLETKERNNLIDNTYNLHYLKTEKLNLKNLAIESNIKYETFKNLFESSIQVDVDLNIQNRNKLLAHFPPASLPREQSPAASVKWPTLLAGAGAAISSLAFAYLSISILLGLGLINPLTSPFVFSFLFTAAIVTGIVMGALVYYHKHENAVRAAEIADLTSHANALKEINNAYKQEKSKRLSQTSELQTEIAQQQEKIIQQQNIKLTAENKSSNSRMYSGISPRQTAPSSSLPSSGNSAPPSSSLPSSRNSAPLSSSLSSSGDSALVPSSLSSSRDSVSLSTSPLTYFNSSSTVTKSPSGYIPSSHQLNSSRSNLNFHLKPPPMNYYARTNIPGSRK